MEESFPSLQREAISDHRSDVLRIVAAFEAHVNARSVSLSSTTRLPLTLRASLTTIYIRSVTNTEETVLLSARRNAERALRAGLPEMARKIPKSQLLRLTLWSKLSSDQRHLIVHLQTSSSN